MLFSVGGIHKSSHSFMPKSRIKEMLAPTFGSRSNQIQGSKPDSGSETRYGASPFKTGDKIENKKVYKIIMIIAEGKA